MITLIAEYPEDKDTINNHIWKIDPNVGSAGFINYKCSKCLCIAWQMNLVQKLSYIMTLSFWKSGPGEIIHPKNCNEVILQSVLL